MNIVDKVIEQAQAEAMEGEPLRITGRDDLVTAVEQIKYSVVERAGKLTLPEGCSVNMDGAIRLFRDIDPTVRSIQVFAGSEWDGAYVLVDGAWIVSGFN